MGLFLFSDHATVTKLRESRENWRSKAEIAQTDLYKSKTEYEQKLQKLVLKHENEIKTRQMNFANFKAETIKEAEKNDIHAQDLITQVDTYETSVTKLNEEINWMRSEFSSCEESKERLQQANQASFEENHATNVCEENNSLLKELLSLAASMELDNNSAAALQQVQQQEQKSVLPKDVVGIQNNEGKAAPQPVVIEQVVGHDENLGLGELYGIEPVEQLDYQGLAGEVAQDLVSVEEREGDVEKAQIPLGGFEPPARIVDNVGFHEKNYEKKVQAEHKEHALSINDFGENVPAVVPAVNIVGESPPPMPLHNENSRRMGRIEGASASELVSKRHKLGASETVNNSIDGIITGRKSKF